MRTFTIIIFLSWLHLLLASSCKKECTGATMHNRESVMREVEGAQLMAMEDTCRRSRGDQFYIKAIRAIGKEKAMGAISCSRQIFDTLKDDACLILNGAVASIYSSKLEGDNHQEERQGAWSNTIISAFGKQCRVSLSQADRLIIDDTLSFPLDFKVCNNGIIEYQFSTFPSNMTLKWENINTAKSADDSEPIDLILTAPSSLAGGKGTKVTSPVIIHKKIPDTGYYIFQRADFQNMPVGACFDLALVRRHTQLVSSPEDQIVEGIWCVCRRCQLGHTS